MSERKELGTEWWYDPNLAGYNGVWKPGIAKIVDYAAIPPKPPFRRYIMRFDGGTHLFATDKALRPINSTRLGPVPTPEDVEEAEIAEAFMAEIKQRMAEAERVLYEKKLQESDAFWAEVDRKVAQRSPNYIVV